MFEIIFDRDKKNCVSSIQEPKINTAPTTAMTFSNFIFHRFGSTCREIPLMWTFCRKCQISPLSWAQATPWPRRCISHRGLAWEHVTNIVRRFFREKKSWTLYKGSYRRTSYQVRRLALHCIAHQNSKSRGCHLQWRLIPTVCKTWGKRTFQSLSEKKQFTLTNMSNKTQEKYLYSKCNCGALDFMGSSFIATCSLL